MPKKIFLLFFLFILLLGGGFLRFYNLSHILLSGDEPLHQVRISYQPLPFVLAHNNGSAFFSLLVHLLLPLGKAELMARLPCAIFGVLTIAAVFFLGKALFSRNEGLIAAFFVAFSPFLIGYSQHSRAYATFVFLSLVSLYFFYRALKENKIKFWLVYSLFTTISLYNHLLSFLILVSYALFVAILWLEGWRKSKKELMKNPAKDQLKNFVIWTLMVLLLAFLLYLPNVGMKDFLLGSAERAITQPSNVSISFLFIEKILRAQIKPQASLFYFLFLIFVILGVRASFGKYPRETLLSFLYVSIPYLIFVAIKPRAVNILSADRYFIFILPVIFLFAAGGVIFLGAFVQSLFFSLKFKKLARAQIKKIVQVFLVLLLVLGLGSSFKDYYLDFWRLGSFSLQKEVRDYLRKKVKRDGIIYFDFFPLSGLITVVNPLTKDLKAEETESIIRGRLEIGEEENDFMIYRIEKMIYEDFVAEKNADLWVVAQREPEKRDKFLALIRNLPEAEVTHLEETTIIHFGENSESLREKLAKMTELFLSLGLDKSREKQFHLLAAKAYLMDRGAEDGIRELNSFRRISLSPEELKMKGSPFVFQVLDRIFGLDPQELHKSNQKRILSEVQRLLFLHGNHFLEKDEWENAQKTYAECLTLGKEYDQKISGRLAALAKKFLALGKTANALSILEKAVQLNLKRLDLRLLLAETYRQQRQEMQAEEEYKRAFGLSSLPFQFLHQIANENLYVFIWEKDSSWHFLFRSKEDSTFLGRIVGKEKIQDTKKINFSGHDSLEILGERALFSLAIPKGQVKAFSFKVARKGQLTFDIKTNGKRDAKKIQVFK